MTITSTQSQHPASVNNVAVGRYIDTAPAAGFTITTGFKPRYVILQNLNASGGVTIEWFEGMADLGAWKRAKTGDGSLLTTTGITPNVDGFDVGYDTDLVYASEQISWMAIG